MPVGSFMLPVASRAECLTVRQAAQCHLILGNGRKERRCAAIGRPCRPSICGFADATLPYLRYVGAGSTSNGAVGRTEGSCLPASAPLHVVVSRTNSPPAAWLLIS